MSSFSSSERVAQRISILKGQLVLQNEAIKNSMGELTDYFKPRRMLARAFNKVSSLSSTVSPIKTIALAGIGIVARKFLLRKIKNSVIKIVAGILPFIALRFLSRYRSDS